MRASAKSCCVLSQVPIRLHRQPWIPQPQACSVLPQWWPALLKWYNLQPLYPVYLYPGLVSDRSFRPKRDARSKPTLISVSRFITVTGIARSVSPGQHVRYVMYSSMTPNTQVVNSGKLSESMQPHVSPANVSTPVMPVRWVLSFYFVYVSAMLFTHSCFALLAGENGSTQCDRALRYDRQLAAP